MVTKKNKNLFLLLLSVIFLLVVLYFSLNKIITLESLTNVIKPVDETADGTYCGTSDPYDSDGVQITKHSVIGGDSEEVLTPGTPFELYSNDTRLDFSDVVGADTPYSFDITTSDVSDTSTQLSTGVTTTGSNGKEARQYTTTLKDNEDVDRCNYTYYVEDNL